MNYPFRMNFEWDEAKSAACFTIRGFDFAYAARAFFDPHRLVQADKCFLFGEDRYQLLGRIDEWLIMVVYTPWPDAIRIISARKANRRRSDTMKTVRMKIDPAAPQTLEVGCIDTARVDATTEADIACQQAEDDAEAMRDAARFARRVRNRLGLSQTDFARRIDVPVETIRNWEQGKRCPTGAAKALLKVIDKAPEAALTALH